MNDSEGVTATVKILRNGTVTIPKEAREALDLETGDIVEITTRCVKKKGKKKTKKAVKAKVKTGERDGQKEQE